MGPRRISRGNGRERSHDQGLPQASMGPRRISRGNARLGRCSRPRWSSFNGAAADQPRKRHAGRAGRRCRLGFNGAAADQPRKPMIDCVIRDAIRASMGPRRISRGNLSSRAARNAMTALQWGRGGSAAETTPRSMVMPVSAGFNGAAADQPRKRALSSVCWSSHTTLQWGRGGSAAETMADWTTNARATFLQWGRGGSAAETPDLPLPPPAPDPLQWGRGGSAAETVPCCGPDRSP